MAKNFRYAKLDENSNFEFAQLPLVIDGVNVWTNIEAEYNKLGFYEITRTEMPEKEGYYYTDFWELENNKIVQRWQEHENPVPEPTEEEQYAEAARILLGEAE